jgi:hypothetical protein
MVGIHSFEPRLGTPLKVIFSVFDRELRAALRGAGIQLCEFEDEIIESRPQIVANLADQDRDSHRREDWYDNLDIVRRFRIKLNDNGLFIFLPESFKPSIEIIKMFSCPIYSFESAVEYVRSGNGF